LEMFPQVRFWTEKDFLFIGIHQVPRQKAVPYCEPESAMA